jgi:hypothetical protein
VAIDVSPPATILVDGRMRFDQQTAIALVLPSGVHHVRAERAGLDAKDWTIQLGHKPTRLEWNFVERSGTVAITSSSDCWASIRVDGQDTGLHTPATIPLHSGDRLIEVYRQGRVIPANSRKVHVDLGQTSRVEFDVPCPP